MGDTMPPLALIDPEALEDYEFLAEIDPADYAQEIASVLPSIRHIDIMIIDKGTTAFSVDENHNVIPSRYLESTIFSLSPIEHLAPWIR